MPDLLMRVLAARLAPGFDLHNFALIFFEKFTLVVQVFLCHKLQQNDTIRGRSKLLTISSLVNGLRGWASSGAASFVCVSGARGIGRG